MKKTILTLALASMVGVVSAQKPAAGAMGLTGGLGSGVMGGVTSGPSATGSLQFKYYVADGLAARVGLNFFNLPGNGTTPGNGTIVQDSTIGAGGDGLHKTTTIRSGTGWALSLGAQKAFAGSDKLEPYIGGDIWFGNTAAQQTDTKTEVVKAYTTWKVGDYIQTITIPGSTFNWGLKGVVGFNYWFVENLALGAEFGYGYLSTSTAGVDNTTTTVTGGTTTTKNVKSTSDQKTQVGTLGVMGSTITLTWLFGK